MCQPPEGWFLSEKWRVYQRVNNEVYVYVSRLFFGWQVQCYKRGSVDYCTLEARTNDASSAGFEKMIGVGDKWLEQYGNDADAMRNDFFNIDGEAWTNGKKEYWI